ncbi:MAG: hypothetical protein E7270_03350 [Lachnospiraceae bacterium]|nr:hypothetical protein [Lachnospiraceae bacterium]
MNYNNYLMKGNDTLTFEKACELMQMIQEELDVRDEIAKDIYRELVETCIEYANTRSKWLLLSKEQKMDTDKSRTLKHDSAIVKFNMLARYFRKEGKKALWRDELGESRKTIGDFACYIALFYGLNAR